MSIVLTRDVQDIPTAVDEFLAERIERNLQASLLVHARAGRLAVDGQLFGWELEQDSVCAFAMRIHPWPLLIGDLDEHRADALVERWLAEDPEIPGVSGVPAPARAVADAWRRRTGGSSSCHMREALHVADEVIDPPRVPPGALRLATPADRALLIAWERAFIVEAGMPTGAAAQAERTIARRLASAAQHVWDDAGPASTLVLSPRIAGTVRVGPVYTPPERRNRGYASVAVARACGASLDAGARRCMLYTDLLNPTSNKIYAALGFRRRGDWEEHAFLPA